MEQLVAGVVSALQDARTWVHGASETAATYIVSVVVGLVFGGIATYLCAEKGKGGNLAVAYLVGTVFALLLSASPLTVGWVCGGGLGIVLEVLRRLLIGTYEEGYTRGYEVSREHIGRLSQRNNELGKEFVQVRAERDVSLAKTQASTVINNQIVFTQEHLQLLLSVFERFQARLVEERVERQKGLESTAKTPTSIPQSQSRDLDAEVVPSNISQKESPREEETDPLEKLTAKERERCTVLLRFLIGMEAINFEQAQRLWGLKKSSTSAQLSASESAGLLRRETVIWRGREKVWWVLSSAGMQRAAALTSSKQYSLFRIREVATRYQDQFEKIGDLAVRLLQAGRAQAVTRRFEVKAWAGAKIPDLLMANREGKKVAFEVELSLQNQGYYTSAVERHLNAIEAGFWQYAVWLTPGNLFENLTRYLTNAAGGKLPRQLRVYDLYRDWSEPAK